MVGYVHKRGRVGLREVGEREGGGGRELVGGEEPAVAREAQLERGQLAGEDEALGALGRGLERLKAPEALVEAVVEVGVQVVGAVLISGELVGGARDLNLAGGGAVGDRAHRGPVAGAVLARVAIEAREPQHHVREVAARVGHVEPQQRGPEVAYARGGAARREGIDVRHVPRRQRPEFRHVMHRSPFSLGRRVHVCPQTLPAAHVNVLTRSMHDVLTSGH